MPSILIVGGGPAGLSAAIYAARANVQTTVLYKDGGALRLYHLAGPVGRAAELPRGGRAVHPLSACRSGEIAAKSVFARGRAPLCKGAFFAPRPPKKRLALDNAGRLAII